MKQNTNMQAISRLSKKFFIVGKVYDTALMTDQEISNAVQKDLDDYIGKGMVDFCIHTEANMISLIFIRSTNYYTEKNIDMIQEMIDADAFMITGEGYQGFHMPLIFPTVPFGYSPYVMAQSDFKQAYKESAELLGADQVKWMKIEVTPHSVVLRIK